MKFLLWAILCMCSAGLSARDSAKTIWDARCKTCHGADGRAQTKLGRKEAIPDFTQQAWQKSVTDEQIRRIIANGSPRNRKMKPFKEKLKPEQIDELTKLIRTFQ